MLKNENSMKKSTLPPSILIFLTSIYFFHRSWWTQMPMVDYLYPESERIAIILGWIQKTLPKSYYDVHFTFYNFYLSILGPHFYKLLSFLNYSIDLESSILLLTRIASAFFALMCIPLMYRIGEKIFNEKTALLSTTFLIVTPIFALYSQTGMHHFHALFFTTWAYYSILSFLSEKNHYLYLRRILQMGISCALLVGISPYGLLILCPAIASVLIRIKSDPEKIKKIILFGTAAFAITFLITNSYVFIHPEWYPLNIFYLLFYNVVQKQTNNGMLSSIYNFLFYMFPHTYGWAVWGLFFYGLLNLSLNSKRLIVKFHFLTTILYFIPYLITGTGALPSRQILMAPFIVLTAGHGLYWLTQKFSLHGKLAAWLVIITVFSWQYITCFAWLNAKMEINLFNKALEWTVPYLKSKTKASLLYTQPAPELTQIQSQLSSINNNITLFPWGALEEQNSDLDRFLRLPFDFAIYADLSAIKLIDPRQKEFRKKLNEFLEKPQDQLRVLTQFKPKVSFLGISFHAPFDDPGLSIVSYASFVIMENCSKKIPLTEALKKIPSDQQAALIHTHSNFSNNGIFTLSELAQKINKWGIRVWVPTDTLFRTWVFKYGPFQKIMTQTSIIKTGIDSYLNELQRIQKAYPVLKIIPGAEITPGYFWSGNFFLTNLVLNNGSKHLLMIGFPNDPLAYQSLPISKSIQPQADRGETPYKNWIWALKKQKSMVFWSHPESIDSRFPVQIDFAKFHTSSYSESLKTTDGYTGFAVLNEGVKLSEPGSLWDSLLLDYCRGERTDPVFVIGESDFGRNGKTLKKEEPYVFTILLEKNPDKILDALEHGRCYAVRRSQNGALMRLNHFSVLPIDKKEVRLRLDIDCEEHKLEIQIIVNGQLIRQYSRPGPFSVSETLYLPNPNKKGYVRIVARDDNGGILISNPKWYNPF